MPTVTLIIATYNRKALLAETLASVFAQTRPVDEIVVADDGSTDGTLDWLKANHPQIKTVRTPGNGGPSKARNLGSTIATGDVIVIFDDDDLMHPHAIQTLLDLLDDFPEAVAAYTDHEYRHLGLGIHHKNHHSTLEMFRRYRQVPPIRTTPRGRLVGRALYKAMLWGNLLQQPYAIRADAYRKLGGYGPDVRYLEDWEFYLRVTCDNLVATSDAVISVHLQRGEGGNMSLDRGQEPMHRRILFRRLRAELFRDPAAVLVVARRLGGYFKTAGDRAYPTSFWTAWRYYVKSFVLWPFDFAVFCGAVLFFLPWILTGKKRKVPDAAVALPPVLKENR